MRKQPPFHPGEIYHVFNHANGFEDMFKNEDNFHYFLRKYGERLHGVVKTLAYCLLPNHFHLLVQVRSPMELAGFYMQKKGLAPRQFDRSGGIEKIDTHLLVRQQFTNFLDGYSKAFNKYHGRSGSLIRQNTRRKLVGTQEYFKNVIHYLNWNAVHHKLVSTPDQWDFSSYHTFLSQRPTKLAREEILQWFGGRDTFLRFHQNRYDEKLVGLLEG